MRLHPRPAALGAALVTLLCAWAPSSRADEVTCDFTISAAPFTITASGHYCLTANLTYTGAVAALVVDANAVVLDLKGYRVIGQGGVGSGAAGIWVQNHNSVTVRNGEVRGFLYGVFLDGGTRNQNNVVERITALANTQYGILVLSPGINNSVRNCVVANTGGSTFTTGTAAGISNSSNPGFVSDSAVTNTTPVSGGTDRFGIVMAAGRAVNNQVIGDGGGGGTNVCLSMSGGANSMYKDNIVSGCTIGYAGGTAVGTTNYP